MFNLEIDSQFLPAIIIHELGLWDKRNWESPTVKKFWPEFNWLKTHLLASYTDVLNGLSHFLAQQTLVGQENLKNP